MKKLKFETNINASAEEVFNTMLNKETFLQWTTEFHPSPDDTGDVEGDWKKGSKILFGDGKGSGMVSKVEENIPNEYMSIRHLGIMKDGVEEFETADAKLWANSFENYTLKENDGKTEVKVDLTDASSPDEFVDFFEKTWPQAMNKVKELAERN